MDQGVAGFAASLLMTLVGLYFSNLVVPQFSRVLSGDAHLANRLDFVSLRLKHLIDVVTSYSALIATILAFYLADLIPRSFAWVGVVLAVLVTLLFIGLAAPRLSGTYVSLFWKGISPATIILALSNILGMVICFLHRTPS